METLKESGVPDATEGRDGRTLEQLALSMYEIRRRFPSDAEYDWYQAEREVGLVELVKSLAEVTSAFGPGACDGDVSAIAKAFSEIRRRAQALFEPYDDRLCSELMEALERTEQTLSGTAGKRRGKAGGPFFGRFRWRSSRPSVTSTP